MKVFIDPGHGGYDSGAVSSSNGLKESETNLNVSLRLGAILQSQGHTVRYSRTTDIYVSLGTRAAEANSWGADYFISVHCNSATDPQANGTETLFYRQGTTAEKLAGYVQKALVAANGLRDRGIKQRNLAVLRLTKMPAILTELAFISNPREAYLLSTSEFRQKCAQGIANGFQNFLAGM